ncbi:MAG: T9SS type A sorting domain-containing protein [Bacteroidetes bacterium]|nr:T9SS type A sorting domain-containing protein [Bacteroidota bacterium]
MKRYIFKHTAIIAFLFVFYSLSAQNQISGVVNYHENPANPLPNITLELLDTGDNLIATTVTNSIGEFDFYNIPSGDYVLVPSTSLPVGNINLIDASMILYYLFGYYTFTDYEFNAADVNGSGNVTFSDYFIVLISYIMQGNPFPTDDWQFEEVNITVSSSRDPIVTTTVWATSTGDVEGVWLPGGRDGELIASDNQVATMVYEGEVELEIGSNYNNLISGFNLNFVYPTNQIEITDVTGPDENFHFDIDQQNGILKVIWLDENENPGNKFFGENLFRVKVKQTTNSVINETGGFSLLEGGMVLDTKSNEIEDIEISLPRIITTSSSSIPNPALNMEVICYPNPVINNLNLKITSQNNCNANIFIYDLNGRLVKEITNQNITKGIQLISIETESLPTGHYLYKLNLGNRNIHGRFQKSN